MNPFLLILIAGFNLLLSAWSVIHGDLRFQTDIARDFLLLNEIEVKKIMLIGPRAGAAGFFHGPLWPYLNFPVYLVANGNPIVLGWFWIILIALFLVYGFFIAQKLFDTKVAYIYTLLASTLFISQAREFTHPQAAILTMPVFFYTLWQYLQTFKYKYLVLHVLTAGVLIQFEVAAGAPFFILSSSYLLITQIKRRKFLHLSGFLWILIPLVTYILFDLRHNFFMLNNLLKFTTESSAYSYTGIWPVLSNRLHYFTSTGIPLLQIFPRVNQVIALIFMVTIIWLRKTSQFHAIYKLFIYLFYGYAFISLFNHYDLAYQHFAPFIPIVLMVFASLISIKRLNSIFIPLLLIILVINETNGIKYVKTLDKFINKDEDSWKQLAQISQEIYTSQDREFGYFVYSPDKLAYEPKYLMLYGARRHPEKQAFYFKKKPVTYIISAPPPLNDAWAKYMTSRWWVINSIKITKSPQKVMNYPNGYTVERYELTPEEMAVPFDLYEDTGLHFR